MSDAEILVLSVRDPRHFAELYERWAEQITKYFYRRTLDPDVAADLAGETLAVAFLRRGRYRPTASPAIAWLYGIARRELNRYFRRSRVEQRALARLGVEPPAMDDESYERIEGLVDLAQIRSQLARAVGQLTDSERRAVVYRVIDDLAYSDIAERLGCSEGAARVRVHRGLTRLAGLMGQP